MKAPSGAPVPRRTGWDRHEPMPCSGVVNSALIETMILLPIVDGPTVAQTLPEALEWVWNGYSARRSDRRNVGTTADKLTEAGSVISRPWSASENNRRAQ